MVRARLGAAFVCVLVSGLLFAPPPIDGHQLPGALRGGLASIAQGHRRVDPGIESRSQAGTREVAVSVELGSAPDELTREALHAAGLTLRGSWRTTIEGYVAPSRLRDLAGVSDVLSVTPIRRALASAFVGPGPALHGATAWQQAGYRGTGVKIGILDGGFDGFAGLMGTELPSTVQVQCYPQIGVASATLADCVTPGVTHGSAVAESIIDMAPAASLYVSNAHSPADLAAATRWMTGAGVRIINFSEGSVPQGMGDGASAYTNSAYALVDLAVAGGALFVAAAGNEGETSWMGPPTDADANGWIDFAPGQEADSLDLGAGDVIRAAIRWASAGSDYDLSIWQGTTKLAESADLQSATRDPQETIDFTAPSAGTYSIRIWHRAGPVAPAIRLMVITSADTALTYRTTDGSLPTPADSRNPGLLTVGAVDYRTPSIVEPYSSRGPTLDGRTKPDLVAADCAPTTILPVFCGTSEAAPFVSGAAALVVEADSAATPAQLADYLRSHATSIGSPVPNNDAGFGLLSLGPLPSSAPTALTFLAPAASGTAGTALLGQPVVGVLDASGQLVTVGPGATLAVALTLAMNPGSGTLACTGGPTAVAVAVAVGGVARFVGCTIDAPGSGYALRADAPTVSGAVGAPFAVAPAGSPPTLSLSASPTAITYGATVSLTAHAALAAGANIAIDFEAGGGGIYHPVGATTTDASGLASLTVTPVISSSYRVRTTVPGTGLVEVSAPVRAVVNLKATLASSIPSGRTISRTTRVTLTETIRPSGTLTARGRARFDVYQRTSSGWVRRRTLYANAGSTGLARITLSLASVGSWWIRSRAEPTATNGASAWTGGVRYIVNR